MMNYIDELKEDIRNYIREEIEYCDYEDIDELEEQQKKFFLFFISLYLHISKQKRLAISR